MARLYSVVLLCWAADLPPSTALARNDSEAGVGHPPTTPPSTSCVSSADGRCICTDEDGDPWDLTGLSGANQVTGPGSSIWTFTYSFNFCENLPLPVGPSCSPSSPNGATAFRVEDYDPISSALCHVMGSDLASGSPSVTKLPQGGGLSVQFATVTYQLTVNLRCDPEVDPDSVPTPPSNYASDMTIEWATAVTCAPPPPPPPPPQSGCGLVGSRSSHRCLCTDTDGDEWDLTDWRGTHVVTGPGTGSYNWDYHWNFCETVEVVPECVTSPGTPTVAYRLEDYPGELPLAFSAGLIGSRLTTHAECVGSFPQCHNMGPNSSSSVVVSKLPEGRGLSIGFVAPVTYSLTVELIHDSEAGVGQPTPPSVFASAVDIEWPTNLPQPHQPGYHCVDNQCVFSEVRLIIMRSCPVPLCWAGLTRCASG
jgi:hypothetical protein